MTLVEITEVLKQIFMFLFVIVGILAVLTLGYAIVAGFIKTLQDRKKVKKAEAELNKAIDDFAETLIKELKKEQAKEAKKEKKVSKTKKTN